MVGVLELGDFISDDTEHVLQTAQRPAVSQLCPPVTVWPWHSEDRSSLCRLETAFVPNEFISGQLVLPNEL